MNAARVFPVLDLAVAGLTVLMLTALSLSSRLKNYTPVGRGCSIPLGGGTARRTI